MSKKPPRSPADRSENAISATPRSKLRLALLAAAPLVLAGGGYAGWALLMAPAEASGTPAAAAPAEEPATADPLQVAALPRDIAAETSFTHSYALSVLVREMCGDIPAPALKAASEEEASADGLLVNLSWVSAARRASLLSEKSCGHFLAEVEDADARAAQIAAEREAAAKAAREGRH